MKTLTAISTVALLALAVPAFADTSDTTARPNGTPGVTSGTDAKGGSLTEGRSSVTDPSYNSNSGMNSNNMGTTTKPNGTPGSTSGTDPK
jgi:hypothetical protein